MSEPHEIFGTSFDFSVLWNLRFHGGRSGSCFFLHNPLHDIESLWWVGVWFLLCHYQFSNLGDVTVQQHIRVVKEFGETLFNNHGDLLSRHRALIGSSIFAKTKPHYFPQAVKYLIVMLNDFREQLQFSTKVTNQKNLRPRCVSKRIM